jgi:hypothetical protein
MIAIEELLADPTLHVSASLYGAGEGSGIKLIVLVRWGHVA